jgi:hypothetical protein
MKVLFFISLLGGLFGGLMLVYTFIASDTAPQQAAGSAMAVAAVIPYCLARSFENNQCTTVSSE